MVENSKISNHVIANLIATYDLSSANTNSVTAIDYLCVYEYEYNGIKYKFRTHQKDNFSSIPETIELSFNKDPSKAYKVNSALATNRKKSSSRFDFLLFIEIFLISAFLLILYFIYKAFKDLTDFDFKMLPIILIIVVIVVTSSIKSSKKQKASKQLDTMLEEAILNNCVAEAHLVKTIDRKWLPNEKRTSYKSYPYKGKYRYQYNGKKYTKSLVFRTYPPTNVRLFFNKNPKKVFYFTDN